MRAAVALAFAIGMLPAAALAQEPSHLERLAGVCADENGAVVGRYAGRVLWTEDGQLSGMMRRDESAEAAGALDTESARGGFAPTSITIPRQAPITENDGWLLRTSAMLASGDGQEIAETTLLCTVAAAPAGRSDPGATDRG
jgi:hypothetical protein